MITYCVKYVYFWNILTGFLYFCVLVHMQGGVIYFKDEINIL
jgi:hypothetical protein